MARNSKRDKSGEGGRERRFISIQYRRNARVNFVKYVRQQRGLRLRLYTAEEGTEEIQGAVHTYGTEREFDNVSMMVQSDAARCRMDCQPDAHACVSAEK